VHYELADSRFFSKVAVHACGFPNWTVIWFQSPRLRGNQLIHAEGITTYINALSAGLAASDLIKLI
jgi:hypothetical protein